MKIQTILIGLQLLLSFSLAQNCAVAGTTFIVGENDIILAKLSESESINVLVDNCADLDDLVKLKERYATELDSVRRQLTTMSLQANEVIDRRISEVRRQLNGQPDSVEQIIQPAFQWAQNDVYIFLQVKFAVRWSSPGAVWVDPSTRVEYVQPQRIYISGSGEGSAGFQKSFELDLKLFDKVIPESAVWSNASVGKVTLTVKKAEMEEWDRLLFSDVKINNMHYWFDMADQLIKDAKDKEGKIVTTKPKKNERGQRDSSSMMNHKKDYKKDHVKKISKANSKPKMQLLSTGTSIRNRVAENPTIFLGIIGFATVLFLKKHFGVSEEEEEKEDEKTKEPERDKPGYVTHEDRKRCRANRYYM